MSDNIKTAIPILCRVAYKKPANAFQQRYYGKLYRMCVVQNCRFQYKYTRYQQDLIRMKELQEEYLFLNREGINGWEDVFRTKQAAEQRIADIDAKKKELYNEHAHYKYQYEKDVDAESLYMVDMPEFEEPDMTKNATNYLRIKRRWNGLELQNAVCRMLFSNL